jgi:hypothetical protein
MSDDDLDSFDPEDVRQVLIDALRENDGAKLRSLLNRLRDNPDPDAREVYERLIRNPALSDLIPH